MKQFTKVILAFLVTLSAASSSWATSREQALAHYLTTPRTESLEKEKSKALEVIAQFYDASALNVIYNKSINEMQQELSAAIRGNNTNIVTEKLEILNLAYQELSKEKKQLIESNRKTAGAVIGLVMGFVVARLKGTAAKYGNESHTDYLKRVMFSGHSGMLRGFGYMFDAGSAVLGAGAGYGIAVGVNKIGDVVLQNQTAVELNSNVGEN